MIVKRFLSSDRRHFFDRQGHRSEVFFYLTGEDIRPVAVEHAAKLAVGFGEKGGFHQAGLVLEGQKLHRVAVLRADHLAGDQQAGHPYLSAGMALQVDGLNDAPVL